jgi:hypothetical protein
MRRDGGWLRRITVLSPADRRALAVATVLVWALRVGIRVLPLPLLQGVLAGGSRRRAERAGRAVTVLERVAWAVNVASRSVPRGVTCLTRGLAAQGLLRRAGVPARLCIGVARGRQGRLEGHAWVESDGRIVIGGAERDRYTLVAVLDGQRP